MNWIDVNDRLPEFHQEVLVLLEAKRFDFEEIVDDFTKYYYQIAQIQAQYKTERPFWVINWDHEPIETIDLIVTHWLPLPDPPIAIDNVKED